MAFPRGMVGRPGKVCLALGRAKSSEGAWDGGILVRTAFLARQASTSKSRLKKGSRAVLKPDRAPSSHSSSREACSPTEDPGRSLLGDTTSVTGQGQEGRCPHVL